MVIVFILRLPPKDSPIKNEGIMRVLWGLDPLGFMTFVPSIICLLLALEVGFIKDKPQTLASYLTVFSGAARPTPGKAAKSYPFLLCLGLHSSYLLLFRSGSMKRQPVSHNTFLPNFCLLMGPGVY